MCAHANISFCFEVTKSAFFFPLHVSSKLMRFDDHIKAMCNLNAHTGNYFARPAS